MTLKPISVLIAGGCMLAASAAHAEPPYERGAYGAPPGHLPPPGECKVWYDGAPPGQQPPPTDCRSARYEAYRNGGRVIYGSDYDRRYREPVWYECDERDYYKGEC